MDNVEQEITEMDRSMSENESHTDRDRWGSLVQSQIRGHSARRCKYSVLLDWKQKSKTNVPIVVVTHTRCSLVSVHLLEIQLFGPIESIVNLDSRMMKKSLKTCLLTRIDD